VIFYITFSLRHCREAGRKERERGTETYETNQATGSRRNMGNDAVSPARFYRARSLDLAKDRTGLRAIVIAHDPWDSWRGFIRTGLSLRSCSLGSSARFLLVSAHACANPAQIVYLDRATRNREQRLLLPFLLPLPLPLPRG